MAMSAYDLNYFFSNTFFPIISVNESILLIALYSRRILSGFVEVANEIFFILR